MTDPICTFSDAHDAVMQDDDQPLSDVVLFLLDRVQSLERRLRKLEDLLADEDFELP